MLCSTRVKPVGAAHLFSTCPSFLARQRSRVPEQNHRLLIGDIPVPASKEISDQRISPPAHTNGSTQRHRGRTFDEIKRPFKMRTKADSVRRFGRRCFPMSLCIMSSPVLILIDLGKS